MFEIDNDMTIHVTRGDVAFFAVSASNGENRYKFQPGDVVRIKVMQRKRAENVAFHKDFLLHEETDSVNIILTEEDTKIGDVISKPTDYWYEVELNPYTNPQTIIGYDVDGPKIFKLYPEGRDLGANLTQADIPVVDKELSLTSERPIANQAVARALVGYDERVAEAEQRIKGTAEETESAFKDATDAIAEETKASINAEAESAIGRVHDSSSEADASAARAKTEADRAEEYAKVAQAVVGLEIDTAISTESYNPIANKAVAEEFGKYLPKSGGTIEGTMIQNVSGDLYNVLKNQNRSISNMISSNGVYEVYDSTNQKTIIRSTLDGTSTFNGTASENLPLTGGDVKGNVTVSANDNSQRYLEVKNTTNDLALYANTNGDIGLHSRSKGKWHSFMDANGNNYFNGTASGNLPLTGGKIEGANTNPLIINSTSSDGDVRLPFQKNGATKGFLGFADTKPTFTDTRYNVHELHHDGNSAKVHIGTTAPNDTTGQVLFINTSA